MWRLEEAAMLLRRTVLDLDAKRKAPDMPWPPPPELKDWSYPPEQVLDFLSVLCLVRR